MDAQWRTSKLKYYLYRRALQQVFDYVQAYNARTGRQVRCYVPTHSLLNYAHWRIVSPESSLARLDGCDGYIAQVWTGTSRTPNLFRGQLRERTFETAFLEYGAMMNLVRGTGRRVWFLNDPVEDNPDHDWTDYRVNWESTMVASLLAAGGLALRGGAVAGAGIRRALSGESQARGAQADAAGIRDRGANGHERAQRHEPTARGVGLRHDGHRADRKRFAHVRARGARSRAIPT